MDLKLAGKTALITGSSSGIGKGCAQVLAEEGCNVIINCHGHIERAQALSSELEDAYAVRSIAIQADVSSEEGIEAIFNEAEKTFPTIDFLVNNAGGGPIKFYPFAEIPTDYWDSTIRLNLYSAFWCSRRFSKDIAARGGTGAIVNVASKSCVLSSSTANESYASAKAGVIGLTRACAKELGPQKIRVNGIIPGYVQTETHYVDGEEYTEKKRSMLPLSDFGKPRDMGYAVAMLLSPLASQINGAMIDCTGGTLV